MRFSIAPHIALGAAMLTVAFLGSCANSGSSQLASRAIDDYCPILPSRTFPTSTAVNGTAIYEYRVNGNGVASDDGTVMTVVSFLNPAERTYSLTVNSRTYTVTSSLDRTAAQQDVVTKLKALINADSSAGLYAYGIAQLTVTQPGSTTPPTVTNLSRLTISSNNPSARPVRLAEVAVKDSNGTIVQCAETLDDGTFQFQLPSDTGNYTVELRSRSNNARASTYVLNNPSGNNQHIVTTTVSSASNQAQTLLIRARVHEGLIAGAFNILDQLLRAQDYLRNETAGCDVSSNPNYFAGCVPFIKAPIVKVYWSPGVSPGIYINTTGSISYYLNGRYELYLQGGQSGNTTSSDMDQFDNSVIIHEYAHFIEDAFSKPNSPGGSHNGDSIIDPRLAWGEGWANFFQAAVTGDPVYRDTYGTPDCTSACAGTYFNESLDPVGTPNNDAPTQGALGEGNFREFSVARMLWDVIKPIGGSSRFSEIWRAIVISETGMRDIGDPFKTVGRLHHIQTQLSDETTWSTLRLNEEQIPGFSVYATPFARGIPGCTTSLVAMSPVRAPGDNGSFATSDQYRNNDFYRFDHSGGVANLELFYSKSSSDTPDLDLYVYKTKYVFGRAADMLISSAFTGDGCPASGAQTAPTNPFRAQNGCPAKPAGLSSTFGYERGSLALAPGTYMINVQADTSIRAGAATNYMLTLNGQAICPQP